MHEETDAPLAPAEELVTNLEGLATDHTRLAELPYELRRRLLAACGRIADPRASERRAMRRALRRKDNREQRERDLQALMQASQRRARNLNKVENGHLPRHALPARAEPPPPLAEAARVVAAGAPDGVPAELGQARYCYVCKAPYTRVHFFYDSMCAACGDLNHRKRTELCDLGGRVALVTGGRVKIGREIVLKLLRCGARVIVTTRFAADAARRYAALPEFAEFAGRLEIHGLDLRHTPSVERLCAHLLGRLARLDFLINNACQTVRRPPAFYAHMLEVERRAAVELAPAARALLAGTPASSSGRPWDRRAPARHPLPSSNPGHALAHADHAFAAELSQLALVPEDRAHDPTLFPEHAYDADGQQVDLRKVNSWRLRLADVSTPELLEVQLVNAVAPFVLNARLKPLMERVPTRDKHIVNVSAVEGQFARGTKTDKHPHTNMAKAALNMLTRTSAPDCLRSGIHMNSVDTGWITDEDPAEHALRKERDGFQPPLDAVDGAARVCDPIVSGFLTGHHLWGQFLKDYAPAAW
jgi:NAD(P)-dependent dehydrogenase (short-subunit alcohol dehydrogenase family)